MEMKIFRFILLAGLVVFIAYVKLTTVSTDPGAGTQPMVNESSRPAPQLVPKKALDVLQIVRSTGRPPEGYVGGRVFENREGRLPDDGDYREFDVDPHQGGRNAERIIVEWRTKKAWYTGDHYQTFTPLP